MYKDKRWLVENYIYLKRSQPDMAKDCNTSAATISYWLNKYDIKPRWKNKEWLKSQHVYKRQDCETIARRCRVTGTTIQYWVNKLDIEKMSRQEYMLSSTTVSLITDSDGYKRFKSSVNRVEKTVGVHQLVLIAHGADPYKVFSMGEYHTHHKNGRPWDNRPDNLELLHNTDHINEHLN